MIIGAYAAAAGEPEDADFGGLLTGLAQDARVTGLEMPSDHLLSQSTARHIFAYAPANWTFAFTCFRGTMLDLRDDPLVGLASTDTIGRGKAVEQMARIHEAVTRINQRRQGPHPQISDVFLHSAPRDGMTLALLASLDELTSWDWLGCQLNLEHCDTIVDDHAAEKGFLRLGDELYAIFKCPRPVGVTINWARSAIEARSPHGPTHHLEQARTSGALRWLMLSGVAARETDFGPAWADAHPVNTVEESSLLTETEVRRALHHTDSDTRLGLKVGLRPSSLSAVERLERTSACLDLVDRARLAGPAEIDQRLPERETQ